MATGARAHRELWRHCGASEAIPRWDTPRSSAGSLAFVRDFHIRVPGDSADSLANECDEGGGRTREGAIAPVNDSQLSPNLAVGNGDELHLTGPDFIAGEGLADNGNAQTGGNEPLDHSDARQFHGNAKPGAVRAELLVEHLAHETGLGKYQRLPGDVAREYRFVRREGIGRADHQHQTIFEDDMNLEAGRFYRQRNDAHVNGAVFDFLENLMAEIAVDADLYRWKAPAILGENVREHVKTRRFVRSDSECAARGAGLVGNGTQRFIPQSEETSCVFKQRFAGNR